MKAYKINATTYETGAIEFKCPPLEVKVAIRWNELRGWMEENSSGCWRPLGDWKKLVKNRTEQLEKKLNN